MVTTDAPATSTTTIRRRVFSLAMPAVGEQLLNTAVGLADIYLVGHLSMETAKQLGYGSAEAISVTGLSNQMIFLASTVFMSVAIGSTALIARAFGSGDRDQANKVVQQSIILGIVFGILSMIAGLLFAEPFLKLLDIPPELLQLGVDFLHIAAISFAPAMLLFVGTACLRGAGDTRTPLWIMLGVNIVNIIICWLLINGRFDLPAMGIIGAAIGASTGRILGGVVIIILLLRGMAGLKLNPRLKADFSMIKRIMNIGIPAAIEQFVFQGAMIIFARFVINLGTAAYAAHNVAFAIQSVSFLAGMGYATAVTTLVGQSLGAKRPDDAKKSTEEALLQCGIVMIILGAILVAFPTWFLQLFTLDMNVVEAGRFPLQTAGIIQLAFALNMIFSGALRGAGDTRWPLYIKLISTWGVRLPVTVVIVGWLGYGLPGIWFAMSLDFTIQGMLAAWRFKTGKWQQIEV
jgi:MATE family multidrug resistance protein